MALGDGIRRNIAQVDPAERDMLRDAIEELNKRNYSGTPGETPPGGVSWWFKQDEIHEATHVHGGPEFLPWHRELTNRFEALIRQINPQLSLHYWDFMKEDPRALPNANLGGGNTGILNLFDPNFMGSPGVQDDGTHAVGPIGDPWLSAGFYDPQAGTAGHPQARGVSGNPADPPQFVWRPSNYPGSPPSPLITAQKESDILALQQWGPAIATNHQGDPAYESIKPNYFRTAWEDIHNQAHVYFANISPHDAFRDPFVFLLHSNVDRIFAMWQCDPMRPERLDPATVYGAESNMDVDVMAVQIHSVQNLTHQVEPWSTGHGQFRDIRPWEPTHENLGIPHDYHHLSIVLPPVYDNFNHPRVFFTIVSRASGKALDLPNTADGTQLQQFTPHGGTNQQWQLIPFYGQEFNGFKIVSRWTSKVLDLPGFNPDDGVIIQEFGDNGGDNQRWQLVPTGDGFFKIVSKASGKVLEVQGGAPDDNVKIQQSTDQGTPSQQWQLSMADAAVFFKIVSRASGKVLDVPGAAPQDGVLIQQFTDRGGNNQHWKLVPTDSGFVEIVSESTGKVLDVPGFNPNDGVKIQQYTPNGGQNQQWQFAAEPDGFVKIVSRSSGKVLEVPGGAPDDGVQIQQSTSLATGDQHQHWRLVPII